LGSSGPYYACSAGAAYVHTIAEALHRYQTGVGPAEVVIGVNTKILLVAPREARRRHERAHLEQQARFAPAWMQKRWARWLLPLSVRAWWGEPDWRDAYWREHLTRGYMFNSFEREAREAEETTTPGVRLPPGPPAWQP
jgi:hypothetical protein